MKEQPQEQMVPLPWVAAGAAVFLIVAALVITGALLLARRNAQVPTPAAFAATGLTPTPDALTIELRAPVDGAEVDLGQRVNLVVSAAAPSGVKLVSLTSNGQGIGTFRGLLETRLEVEQTWTPAYAGYHEIVAAVSSRAGSYVTTEPIRIRVVDRQLMAEHAPIWANVQSNVTAMRGLAPTEEIEPILLSRTELRQRLRDEEIYSLDEADSYVRVLAAFDFVPPDFDLYQLYQRYLGESIAGYYDPRTAEFVVISDDDEVDALEQWIYAHEFMHALQDQHFQLDLIADTSLGFEENLALRALAEGEAELLQNMYIEQGYFAEEELVEIFNLVSRMRTTQVGYLPPVLVNSGLFPYTVGHEFAQALHEQGEWEALNAAWQQPPHSTEQILHPQRYLNGDAPQPVSLVSLTGTLGSEWTLIEEGPFGEFLLREYLAQQLTEDVVDIAATGWGGDFYAVYHNAQTDQLVMALRSAWDSGADREEFIQAYLAYADGAYGNQRQGGPQGGTCWQGVDVVCLYPGGDQTLVLRAPDLEVTASLAEALMP